MLFGTASAAALSSLAMMRGAVDQITSVHTSGSTAAGATGTPIPTPGALPDCVVVPALTEGHIL